ncbi:hypothetical protein ACWDDN_45575 [Streptomyces griseoruber]
MNLRTFITGSVPGTVQITAYVSYDTRKDLDGLKSFFAQQRAWAGEQPMASTAGMTRREADARRALWQDQKVELRYTGQLIDSLNALVTGGLFRELEERGWNRPWDPFPRQARAPGRSPGSPRGVWQEPVSVRLPVDLVNTVYAACWHTSKEPRTLLEEWKRRHPKACPNRTKRPGCDEAALAEYRQICATITHRGDLWRAAVLNGLDKARASQDPATGMP